MNTASAQDWETSTLEWIDTAIRDLTALPHGSRDLDMIVQRAFGGEATYFQSIGYRGRSCGASRWEVLPRWTYSLDKALSSIPQKHQPWTRAVDASAPELGIRVDLFSPDKSRFPDVNGDHLNEIHATLIASLRAWREIRRAGFQS